MKVTVILSILIMARAVFASEIVSYTYSPAGRLTAATYDSGDTNASTRLMYDANNGLVQRVSTFSTDGDTLDDQWELAKFGDRDETDAGDPDQDGLANTNEFSFGSHPDLADSDFDAADDYHEWVADTDPNNPSSKFEIVSVVVSNAPPAVSVTFPSSAARHYALQTRANLITGDWQSVSGQIGIQGSGMTDTLIDDSPTHIGFYNVEVTKP